MEKKYIEANSLIKIIENTYLDGDSSESHLTINDEDTLIGKFQTIDIISDMPTADVQEIKHGKWLSEYEPDGTLYCFHCSLCDDDFHNISHKSMTKFCSDCGAKMDIEGWENCDCENCEMLCCDNCELYEEAKIDGE